MDLLKKILGERPVSDEPLGDQLNDLKQWYEADPELKIEAECDVIPGGHGPFGRCFTNPIPVNGVSGEMVYLNRLRSKTGVRFLFHRLGNYPSEVCEQKTDLYELVAIDGSEWTNLVFNMYYPRRSTKPPEGVTLVPWNGFKDIERLTLKFCGFGSHLFVNNFPHGLPDAVEEDKRLNSLIPGLGIRVADKVRRQMQARQGKWDIWNNPFLGTLNGLISVSDRRQMETQSTNTISAASEAGSAIGEMRIENKDQAMHVTLLDQIGKHLQFLGYEIIDREKGFLANHPSKPRFNVLPYFDGLLFSCTFTMGESARANQFSYLSLLNGGNHRAAVSRFYASDDNSLVHECFFLGEYDRVQFARFFELWEKDYQQLSQLPEAAVVFS